MAEIIWQGLIEGLWRFLRHWSFWLLMATLLLVCFGPQFLRRLPARGGGAAPGRAQRDRASLGEAKLNGMGTREFQRHLMGLFRQLGYAEVQTSFTGGYGSELIVTRDGERILIHDRTWTTSVSWIFQQAADAGARFRCRRVLLVLNQPLTAPARELAVSKGVEVWERRWLVETLQHLQLSADPGVAPLPAAPGKLPPGGGSPTKSSRSGVSRE